MFGNVYVWIEQSKEYPNDSNILGMKIDKDLQEMNRKRLCHLSIPCSIQQEITQIIYKHK